MTWWTVFVVDYVVRLAIAQSRWRRFYRHLLNLAMVVDLDHRPGVRTMGPTRMDGDVQLIGRKSEIAARDAVSGVLPSRDLCA